MNRVDFINQLERLLQSIAPGEREEALQYYNDYFDDAGKENEQEVIEALGNPARVAENIKRDLLGNGYGGPVARAQASDRALVEYGKETEEETSPDENPEGGKEGDGKTSGKPSGSVTFPENGNGGQGALGFGGSAEKRETPGPGRSCEGDLNSRDTYGQNAYEPPVENGGMPPWAVALLATLLILASPMLLGIVCVLFSLVVVWYVLLACVGMVAVALLVMLVVLVVTGILCCFVNPWVGMALAGGGLVCGGIGMIFLMITAAMGGIVTPAIWRGLGFLFRRRRKKVNRG